MATPGTDRLPTASAIAVLTVKTGHAGGHSGRSVERQSISKMSRTAQERLDVVRERTDRNLWQFQSRFCRDNDGLNASQFYALLVTRGMREQQRIGPTGYPSLVRQCCHIDSQYVSGFFSGRLVRPDEYTHDQPARLVEGQRVIGLARSPQRARPRLPRTTTVSRQIK
jgi:hypothetical protein